MEPTGVEGYAAPVWIGFAAGAQCHSGPDYSTKRIQRDALKGIIPDEIRTRRDKIGWNSPSHEWFNSSMKDEIYNLLKKDDSKNLNFHRQKAFKSFNSFIKRKNPTFNDGYKTWLNLQPYLWRKSLESPIWR